jgi:hypothetical protein
MFGLPFYPIAAVKRAVSRMSAGTQTSPGLKGLKRSRAKKS